MRDWLTFAAVWLFQRIRSCALALLVALITTCITTTARASVGPTVTSKPPGLSDTATAFRHDAENPLRVPHDRANARRLGAPGARSEASTHGPCSADTAPRGRHLGRLTSRCYRYVDGPERCYTATYDAANNPTTLTDPEMRRELSYDSLDRITEVKRFVPSNATTPSHVETYSYNALGGLAIHDGVSLADQRPRLDGTGTASAGIPASLAGSPVSLDNGGRVTSLSGTNFTYYRFDHRLQSFVTGATTESFAYDTLLRTTELRRNGATVEVYLRDDLSDNIAAVSNGTPGLAGMRRRIIWDGVDHPLWMFDADRGVTVYFELDTTGNVRRLHAGERVTGNGSFSGDLGGYSYTAFGRNIPATEPGGEATPKIDAVDYVQRLQWQGRWLYNRSGGLYDFRARFWSPQLGAFLQLDRYQFLSSGGTLWSWPGQNPFRWRDPSGRYWVDENGNRNWEEWEVQAILADAIADYALPGMFGQHKGRLRVCGESFMNAGPFGGPYDFKHHPFFKDDFFWVPGVGRINAAMFGNYFAGYVNETALSHPLFPDAGLFLTLAGGVLTHTGDLGDDAASVEAIERGSSDSNAYFQTHPWPGSGGGISPATSPNWSPGVE